MGGIRELLDGKIWEWNLSFRWEWEWDGNGNVVIKMGGNWYEKSVPAHLYCGPGGQEISIDSGAAWRHSSTAHSSAALGSICEQCHVVSRRRNVNTDLLGIILVHVHVTRLSCDGIETAFAYLRS